MPTRTRPLRYSAAPPAVLNAQLVLWTPEIDAAVDASGHVLQLTKGLEPKDLATLLPLVFPKAHAKINASSQTSFEAHTAATRACGVKI